MHRLSRKKLFAAESWILASFSILGLLGILRHEMWRDELQAWMLARDSSSLADLLQNMSHEGHPLLWHLCLYGLSQLTRSPWIMQLFHLLISIGIIYLITKLSPFSIGHKLLLSFGYFIFFEYTFISRNYNISLFLALLFCTVYTHLGRRYFSSGIILLLLANTNAYALILGMTLSLFMILEEMERPSDRWMLPSELISSLTLIGLGFLVSTVQIGQRSVLELIQGLATPNFVLDILGLNSRSTASSSAAPDMVNNLGAAPLANDQIGSIIHVVANVWKSYVPVPLMYRFHFWNSNALEIFSEKFPAVSAFGVPLGNLMAFGLAIITLVVLTYIFSSDRTVLTIYWVGTSCLALFQYVLLEYTVHEVHYARHQGYYFILLVVCVWLFKARSASPRRRLSEPGRRSKLRFGVLTLIFGLQAIAGIYAASMDYAYPFSASKAAAAFIQQNNLENTAIFGSRYRQASVISGYLDVPIYYPEKQATGTFWTTFLPEITSQDQLVEQIETRIDVAPDHQLLLVLTQPLAGDMSISPTIDVKELAEFDQSIMYENLYLYLARRL